jgi:hypothetical protein
VRAVAVVRPRRGGRLAIEVLDRLLEVVQVRVDQAGAEAGALQLGPDIALAVGVGVFPLGASVQLDVREDALLEPPPAFEQRGGL